MVKSILLTVCALVSFLIAALAGYKVIPFLHKLKFGQTIREVGPTWHQKKQGTPTMGGILFIAATLAAAAALIAIYDLGFDGDAFSANPASRHALIAGALTALCCGGIGFLDDYIKVVKKRNLGLTVVQKLLLQFAVGGGYGLSLYLGGGSLLYVPFLGWTEFGWWIIPFCLFVVTAMINATNLTDGIDGLCAGIALPVLLLFIAVSVGYSGQTFVAAAFFGALLGFLVWNAPPARVFMGDTGSLFIGGMLTAVAFGIRQPFLLIPTCIVYILDMFSVVLQVGYFKLTHGKRLFKMSPVHHHFEMCGWKERTIDAVFVGTTMLGCVAAWFLRA